MEPWEEGPSTGVGGALAITMEEMGTWEGSGRKRGWGFLGLYRFPHWTLGHRCGAEQGGGEPCRMGPGIERRGGCWELL